MESTPTPPPPPPPDKPSFERVIQALRRAMWNAGTEAANAQGAPKAWVGGVDDAGLVIVNVEVDESLVQLKLPDLQTLAMIVGQPLKPMRAPDALKLPFVSKTGPKLETKEHPVEPAQAVSLHRAGGGAQQMTAIDIVRGTASAVAAYTFRGPTKEAQGMEYKPFNEDGVVLRLRRGDREKGVDEIVGLGVFDQAGGEGAVDDSNGAASDAAAKAFDVAVQKIETGEEPEKALREGVLRASDAVRDLGVGAVSTIAGAIVISKFVKEGETTTVKRTAHVVTCGDSRVLLVGKDGVIKQKTRLHNFGAAVAAGETSDVPQFMALQFASALSRGLGTQDDEPDMASWTIEPGDRLVLETDGLGDARELEEMPAGMWHADACAEEQGRILAHVKSPDEAVNALVGYALDQMAEKFGKPDNIGVGVIEILE